MGGAKKKRKGDRSALPLDPFHQFYRIAEARNQAFVDNLGTPDSAVLIAGGFHTPGLKHILQKKGFSTVVLTPRLTKVDGLKGTDYLKMFLEKQSPIEILFQGKRLFLGLAAGMGAVNPQPLLVPRRMHAHNRFLSHYDEANGTHFSSLLRPAWKKLQSSPPILAATLLIAGFLLTSLLDATAASTTMMAASPIILTDKSFPVGEEGEQIQDAAISKSGNRTATSHHRNGLAINVFNNATKSRIQRLTGFTSKPNRLVLSDDGEMLVSVHPEEAVYIWDVSTGKRRSLPIFDTTKTIYSLAISPDNRYVATGEDDAIRVRDISTNPSTKDRSIIPQKRVGALAFTPDGRFLFSGGQESILLRRERMADGKWQPSSKATNNSFQIDEDAVAIGSLDTSPDGKTLVVGVDNELYLVEWDDGGPKATPVLYIDGDYFDLNRFSPNGNHLWIGTKRKKRFLVDIQSFQILYFEGRNNMPVRAIGFGEDGPAVLYTPAFGIPEVRVWKPTVDQKPETVKPRVFINTDPIRSVSHGKDALLINIDPRDKKNAPHFKVLEWSPHSKSDDPLEKTPSFSLPKESGPIEEGVISPTADNFVRVAVRSKFGYTNLFNINAIEPYRDLRRINADEKENDLSATFSFDGSLVAVARDHSGTVDIFKVKNVELIRTLNPQEGAPRPNVLRISPDNRFLASAHTNPPLLKASIFIQGIGESDQTKHSLLTDMDLIDDLDFVKQNPNILIVAGEVLDSNVPDIQSNGILEGWDAQTGERLFSHSLGEVTNSNVATSRFVPLVAAVSGDQEVQLYFLDGQNTPPVSLPIKGIQSVHQEFVKNEEREKNDLEVKHVSDGAGYPSVVSLDFDPGTGKKLFVTTHDGLIRWFDVQEIYRRLYFREENRVFGPTQNSLAHVASSKGTLFLSENQREDLLDKERTPLIVVSEDGVSHSLSYPSSIAPVPFVRELEIAKDGSFGFLVASNTSLRHLAQTEEGAYTIGDLLATNVVTHTLHPENRWVAYSQNQNTVQFMEPETTKKMDEKEILVDGIISDLDHSPDGNVLLIAEGRKLTTWDISQDASSEGPLQTFPAPPQLPVMEARFTPDGRLVGSRSLTHFCLHQADTLEQISPPIQFYRGEYIPEARGVGHLNLDGIQKIAFHPNPDNPLVAILTEKASSREEEASSRDKSVHLFDFGDPAEPRYLWSWRGPEANQKLMSMDFHSDGQHLLLADNQGSVWKFPVPQPKDNPNHHWFPTGAAQTLAWLWEGGDKNLLFQERKQIMLERAPRERKFLYFVVTVIAWLFSWAIVAHPGVFLPSSFQWTLYFTSITVSFSLGLAWGLAHLGGTYEVMEGGKIRYVSWAEQIRSTKWWAHAIRLGFDTGNDLALFSAIIGFYPMFSHEFSSHILLPILFLLFYVILIPILILYISHLAKKHHAKENKEVISTQEEAGDTHNMEGSPSQANISDSIKENQYIDGVAVDERHRILYHTRYKSHLAKADPEVKYTKYHRDRNVAIRTINQYRYSQDQKVALRWNEDGIWHIENPFEPNSAEYRIRDSLKVTAADISSDGSFVVYAVGALVYFETRDGNPETKSSHSLGKHSITNLAISPDGKSMVMADDKGNLVHWNIDDWRNEGPKFVKSFQPKLQKGTSNIQYKIKISPDGRKVASLADWDVESEPDQIFSLWDLEERPKNKEWRPQKIPAPLEVRHWSDMAFSADGSILIQSDKKNRYVLFSSLNAKEDDVKYLEWTHDSTDWPDKEIREGYALDPSESPIIDIAVSPDKKEIVAATEKKWVIKKTMPSLRDLTLTSIGLFLGVMGALQLGDSSVTTAFLFGFALPKIHSNKTTALLKSVSPFRELGLWQVGRSGVHDKRDFREERQESLLDRQMRNQIETLRAVGQSS